MERWKRVLYNLARPTASSERPTWPISQCAIARECFELEGKSKKEETASAFESAFDLETLQSIVRVVLLSRFSLLIWHWSRVKFIDEALLLSCASYREMHGFFQIAELKYCNKITKRWQQKKPPFLIFFQLRFNLLQQHKLWWLPCRTGTSLLRIPTYTLLKSNYTLHETKTFRDMLHRAPKKVN